MGLSRSVQLHTLELKGNNIREKGALAIGNFLKKNHVLKRLLLEWNAIGSSVDAVKELSKPLGTNSSLLALDLRNNHINHVGAADLADALSSNTTLQVLDLRWNNIGLTGGRCLLEALKVNHALTKLELAGNGVHLDIIKAVETALLNNSDRRLVVEQYSQRELQLTRGLHDMEKTAQRQLTDLIYRMEKQQEDFTQTHRLSSAKIIKLHEALQDRMLACLSFESQIKRLQSSLDVADQEKQDLLSQLRACRDEASTFRQQHLNIMQQTRGEHSEREQVLLSELRDIREKNRSFEEKVLEQKQTIEASFRKATSLEEELNDSKYSEKKKLDAVNEQLEKEQRCWKEQLENITKKWQESEMAVGSAKGNVKELEKQIGFLQSQISRLTIDAATTEKRSASESSQQENKYLRMKAAYDELEKNFSALKLTNRELQGSKESLHVEIEVQRKFSAQVTQLLTKKDELLQDRTELCSSLKSKESALEREIDAVKHLTVENKKLEKELQAQVKAYEGQLKQKDVEILALQEQLRLKEDHWRKLSAMEAQRAALLHSTIGAYLHGTPPIN